jgi:hypothetical protein
MAFPAFLNKVYKVKFGLFTMTQHCHFKSVRDKWPLGELNPGSVSRYKNCSPFCPVLVLSGPGK